MESTLELPDIFFLSDFLDLAEEDDDEEAMESSAGGSGVASEGTDFGSTPVCGPSPLAGA